MTERAVDIITSPADPKTSRLRAGAWFVEVYRAFDSEEEARAWASSLPDDNSTMVKLSRWWFDGR